MRYLIDTNIFIYMIADKPSLSRDVNHIIDDCSNLLYISSESVKEMIHLFQTGKVIVKKWKTAQDIVDSIEKEWNMAIKYVQREHLVAFSGLARVENHNDPSDRLIIAQAICEKIPLISSDGKFVHYRKQDLQFVFNKK
ncbi:twitching motility protein PilT [Bacteroidia bacterium]|nr:twitching motility protein PilT [Bacteroidia bacterium]GHT47757.1 twitching motility protein PilT [Bacteroidia bacterium]